MGGVSPCPCKQLPAPIYAALCLAENCIGPRSYRPDDIITMHSGKKSEIRNQKSENGAVWSTFFIPFWFISFWFISFWFIYAIVHIILVHMICDHKSSHFLLKHDCQLPQTVVLDRPARPADRQHRQLYKLDLPPRQARN